MFVLTRGDGHERLRAQIEGNWKKERAKFGCLDGVRITVSRRSKSYYKFVI